jgi:hypothetical protein
MIGNKFNFEDVFFRDLTVCVLDTLEGQVRWVNRFSSGDRPVNVPFYYSLTGDERFLLDSFSDDIVSNNRFVDLNTDIIPRGHLTMTGFNIKSDEFANPNVWLRMVVENEEEIRKILARVRAIPISVNYELTILLDSEIDTFKCAQAIMDTLWIYKFMYFEHNFMNIDAVILMPDTNQIEMSREKNLTSDNKVQLKASFEVSTYYPAYRRDRISAPGRKRGPGTGMTDFPDWIIPGEPDIINEEDPFNRPGISVNGYPSPGFPTPPYTGGPPWNTGFPGETTGVTISTPFSPFFAIYNEGDYGKTSSWTNTSATGDIFGSGAAKQIIGGRLVDDPDYYLIAPKRTRWFNNILRAREQSGIPVNNPNGKPPIRPNPNSNPPINPNE